MISLTINTDMMSLGWKARKQIHLLDLEFMEERMKELILDLQDTNKMSLFVILKF